MPCVLGSINKEMKKCILPKGGTLNYMTKGWVILSLPHSWEGEVALFSPFWGYILEYNVFTQINGFKLPFPFRRLPPWLT